MPFTMPGIKVSHSLSTSHPCRYFSQSIMDCQKSAEGQVYPYIGCFSLSSNALRIKSGVSKSMSATHKGKRSSLPNNGFNFSSFTAWVPDLSMMVSKLYFILLYFAMNQVFLCL